ncbi:hypothetical protein BGW41_002943 [Actinomortierella wolfii]|nr:hypothetical protein BGW41_002943 [Actinomortierella wolfii]
MGKSFGEPVDFYPLPGHTPGCSGGEQHELELVEEGEVDGNKSTDTLFCQSTGFVDTPSDAINESTKREDHVCLLIPPSHNNDPFAVQDSVTQEYTTYRPPLPRYTTLPPTNVYPIPQTPSSRRSNNKKDGCNSDDIAEGVLGVAAGVAEIFLND